MENLHRSKKAPPAHIGRLIRKFILDTITEPEHTELDAWILENDENMKLFEDLTDPAVTKDLLRKRSRRQRTIGRASVPWLTLAGVLLLMGYFIYHFAFRTENIIPDHGTGNRSSHHVASLSIPGEKDIDLSLRAIGNIDKGIDKISDSQLVYKNIPNADQRVHTISTPQGSMFCITLSDGSKIWLNAATTLSYPNSFSDEIREVRLTGEAYFAVEPDAKRPFRVMLPDSSIVIVTGTHFNINNYANEPVSAVTLNEGKLGITSLGKAFNLTPGEQIEIMRTGSATISNVDTNTVTSWMRGFISYNNRDLHYIMRQVERWYKVHVVLASNPKVRLFGTIYKEENMQAFLSKLTSSSNINFKLVKDSLYVY